MVRRFYAVGSSLPFLVGAALRLWNLRDQILGGDETHAIRAALNFTLPKILVTYQVTDNCIPLTALYKLFLLGGMPLTETLLRLPVLFCGMAALLALPAAFAGRLDRGTILVYHWLLAISPVLVLYSRIARSYMPMVLFSFGAVMAFEAWWRTRSWKSGAAYVLLGALAVWFHLGAGPIVAAPFLFAAGDALIQRKDLGRNLRDLLLLGLAVAAAFALFLVPAMGSLLEVVAGKRVEQSVPWGQALSGILRLQAGTAALWLAILFWLAAFAGLALLIRSERRLALFTVTVVVGHIAGLLVLSPFGLAISCPSSPSCCSGWRRGSAGSERPAPWPRSLSGRRSWRPGRSPTAPPSIPRSCTTTTSWASTNPGRCCRPGRCRISIASSTARRWSSSPGPSSGRPTAPSTSTRRSMAGG
jgi:hypothetical protein